MRYDGLAEILEKITSGLAIVIFIVFMGFMVFCAIYEMIREAQDKKQAAKEKELEGLDEL